MTKAEKEAAKAAKEAELEVEAEETTDEVETSTKAKKSEKIIVADPQVLRPRELPLVVKTASGKWANEAQARFAANLNAYAYKNPEKWAEKKDVLIAQLEELATKPNKIVFYEGAQGNLSYKNKLIQE